MSTELIKVLRLRDFGHKNVGLRRIAKLPCFICLNDQEKARDTSNVWVVGRLYDPTTSQNHCEWMALYSTLFPMILSVSLILFNFAPASRVSSGFIRNAGNSPVTALWFLNHVRFSKRAKASHSSAQALQTSPCGEICEKVHKARCYEFCRN